jgi:cobalt-zinc-cadmium resistance protein CzcA
MRVIEFILKRRLLVSVMLLVLLVAGAVTWDRLPIDAFPDMTNTQVMVLSKAEGLTAEEVERQVTLPVERALSGLPGVKLVRSLSTSALSQVVLVFDDTVDIYFARQLAHERLSDLGEEMPAGVRPELGPVSTGLGEIYQYTIEAGWYCPEHREAWSTAEGTCPHDGKALVRSDLGPMELRTLQDWVVVPQLKRVAGVNEVNSFGGLVKEYQVLPESERLAAYGVTLGEVTEAVAQGNANAGAGFVSNGEEQRYVLSRGLAAGEADLAASVIGADHDTPVTVGRVATVTVGAMPRHGAATRDGRGEVVSGAAILLKGENSRAVVERVKQEIEVLQKTLPAGVRIVPYYDRTDLILASVHTVSGALMEGILLVLFVLFLFLWDVRGALLVALSLPFTAAVTFLTMGAAGLSANLMSLGGLAVAIGMVVDGAIIVTENIIRYLKEGRGAGCDRVGLVAAATAEVARPVFFSILVIVAVLLPVFGLEEMEGKLFKPMVLTMIAAMAASLAAALVMVPPLASVVIPVAHDERPNPVVGLLSALYRPVLDAALGHRWVVAGIALLFMAAAVAVNPCTDGDVCSGMACAPGPPLVCNDGNGCTDDTCDAGKGCVYTPNAAACEDGNVCTQGDKCGGGSCVPGPQITCNDKNACTDDSCSPTNGCVFLPNVNPCVPNGARTGDSIFRKQFPVLIDLSLTAMRVSPSRSPV